MCVALEKKFISILFALALGGCHRHPPPPVAPPFDAGLVVNALPTTTVPTADAQVDPSMPILPAVSIDGSLVAVRMIDPQGARGEPKVWVGFIDVVLDRVVKKVLITDPDHPETEGAGQAELLATINQQKWTPLSPLIVHEDPGAPLRHGSMDDPSRATMAEKNGLIVQYREPDLSVRRAGKEILKTKAKTYSVPAAERCPGCGICPAPLATIDEAFTDDANDMVLLAIVYGGGSDICWEPADSYHVVALKK